MSVAFSSINSKLLNPENTTEMELEHPVIEAQSPLALASLPERPLSIESSPEPEIEIAPPAPALVSPDYPGRREDTRGSLKKLWDALREPHAAIRADDSNLSATHTSVRALIDNLTHVAGAPISFIGNIGASIANLGRAVTSALVRSRPEIDSTRQESNSQIFMKRAGINITEAGKDIADFLIHTQATIPNAVRTLLYGLATAADAGLGILNLAGV